MTRNMYANHKLDAAHCNFDHSIFAKVSLFISGKQASPRGTYQNEGRVLQVLPLYLALAQVHDYTADCWIIYWYVPSKHEPGRTNRHNFYSNAFSSKLSHNRYFKINTKIQAAAANLWTQHGACCSYSMVWLRDRAVGSCIMGICIQQGDLEMHNKVNFLTH